MNCLLNIAILLALICIILLLIYGIYYIRTQFRDKKSDENSIVKEKVEELIKNQAEYLKNKK